MNNLGKNLRYLRESKKMKQEEMKSLFGTTPQTWSNYENAYTEPKLELLIRISNFFGMNLHDLILGDLQEGEVTLSPRKTKLYQQQQDRLATLGEADVKYIVKELKLLREEVDEIKQSGVKRTNKRQ
ncbi:MAG: helix-turn-helix transcriptional regulator [Chitinophagaceae bacterium]